MNNCGCLPVCFPGFRFLRRYKCTRILSFPPEFKANNLTLAPKMVIFSLTGSWAGKFHEPYSGIQVLSSGIHQVLFFLLPAARLFCISSKAIINFIDTLSALLPAFRVSWFFGLGPVEKVFRFTLFVLCLFRNGVVHWVSVLPRLLFPLPGPFKLQTGCLNYI